MSQTLSARMQQDGFSGYAYAYPHKTSYRPLDPPIPLTEAWRDEPKDALFLYVHLPFCEMRCGFCNLFTTVQPNQEFVDSTLDSMERQSRAVATAVNADQFSQLAFGGGTPSFLSARQLTRLFSNLSEIWELDWRRISSSFEVSPATVNPTKLAILKEHYFNRVSIGIQSFCQQDLQQLGRPQSSSEVERTIEWIKAENFDIFNIDLIYGVEGQTMTSWLETIEKAVKICPEELFLYPLYVRELTGLARIGKRPVDHRRQLLAAATELLISEGYEQQSMRLFRRKGVSCHSDYCCQEDGMVGIGPGARSYTQSLHYSSEYAVGQSGVRQIIADYQKRSDRAFAIADYGVVLDSQEQRRRFVIKSLLRNDGLCLDNYADKFAADVFEDLPQLYELLELQLAIRTGTHLHLNPEGMSWSDVIGPWLYSSAVISKMEACDLV